MARSDVTGVDEAQLVPAGLRLARLIKELEGGTGTAEGTAEGVALAMLDLGLDPTDMAALGVVVAALFEKRSVSADQKIQLAAILGAMVGARLTQKPTQ